MEGMHAARKDDLEPEKIKIAAFRYRGEIFTGVNHAVAFETLEQKYPEYKLREVEDGFLTSKGRYVDREEAMRIAKVQGQIDETPMTRAFPILDSYSLKKDEDAK